MKILVIEDNPDIRDNTAEILALANYEVLLAENGKKGVELAQTMAPDLIICDIMMPELDGYGVLHILNKRVDTSAIPFIFLTAKTEKSDLRKGMNMGADDYLTKPFESMDLLNAVETRLRKHALITKEYESNADGLDRFIHDARLAINADDLCKDKKTKLFKKKIEVFAEGDIPSAIYFIKTGSVKSYQLHPDGKELITNIYKTNDFFGFEAMLSLAQYTETTVTLEDSEIICIPKIDFLTLISNHSGIAAAFISILCRKIADKEKQLVNLAYNSIRQRTAEAILKIASLKNANEKISLSRDDLSKIVGTASESVIRVLSDFKEEHLIDIEGGKITVLQPQKLEKVVRWNVAR